MHFNADHIPDLPDGTLTRPRFTKRRLAALIAAGALMHACSTLPPGQAQGPESADRNTGATAETVAQGRRQQARGTRIPQQVVVSDHDLVAPEIPPTNIWQRLNHGFSFALAEDNDLVMEALDWYVSNPGYMQQVAERAQPFLYLIVDRIEERGLPTELALLPVVESTYNPNAVSQQNAVGLWQFMASTAISMGLKSDWWYDARRDPLASTDAALDYLESLYTMFDNDWLMALAAYNMGQGNLQRAIRRNAANGEPVDFWSLQLPTETRRHVPRVLALAHLLADAEHHGIELDPFPNEPYLVVVDAGSQIDLSLVANISGLEPEVIYRLNPGYRQWATHPDGPHTILLPVGHAEKFTNGLATLTEQQRVTWDRYVIQPGDTLGAIANRYRTRVNILQSVNNLSGSRIIAGDSLLIPRAYNAIDPPDAPDAPIYPSGSQPDVTIASNYRVRSGDSLWRIANRHNVTAGELAEWNNIQLDSVLRPGQTLRLQPAAVAMRGASEQSAVPGTIHYQIQPGDSLSRIAREHNIGVDDIVSWNSIQPNDLIYPGQELILHLSEINQAIRSGVHR